MSKFYTLSQNNSGGYLIQNENVDAYVIIEALNIEQFRELAEDILDNYRAFCPCCGQRWNDVYIEESDADEEPMIYGDPAENFIPSYCLRIEKVITYYLDGRKTIFNLETRKYEE